MPTVASQSVNIPKAHRSAPNTLQVLDACLTLASHGLLLRALQLLILPLVHVAQAQSQADDHQADGGVGGATGDVARLVGLRIHVGAVDGGGVGDAIADGDGAGALD